MTTVAQMIEWMKTLPQDAVVERGEEVYGNYNGYTNYNGYMIHKPVDIESSIVFAGIVRLYAE